MLILSLAVLLFLWLLWELLFAPKLKQRPERRGFEVKPIRKIEQAESPTSNDAE